MTTTVPFSAQVVVLNPFEERVARAFTWALFVGLWAKLAVAVMLTQPIIDAEAESSYNRLADMLLLSVTASFALAVMAAAPGECPRSGPAAIRRGFWPAGPAWCWPPPPF